MSRARVALIGATLTAVGSLPAPAQACASCGCGDPTLTTLGTTKPFAGRLRAALQLAYRTDAVGREGLNRVELREARLDASVAAAGCSALQPANSGRWKIDLVPAPLHCPDPG
jgi:hypothetical protein